MSGRTNPFSKTYKSWHCGEVEQVGGGYSNATSHGQPASAQHWGGQHFYPGSIIHLVLAYCWRSGLANQALLNLMSSTSHFASPLNSTQSKLQKTTHCGEGLSYNWLLPTNIAFITWSKLKSVLDWLLITPITQHSSLRSWTKQRSIVPKGQLPQKQGLFWNVSPKYWTILILRIQCLCKHQQENGCKRLYTNELLR